MLKRAVRDVSNILHGRRDRVLEKYIRPISGCGTMHILGMHSASGHTGQESAAASIHSRLITANRRFYVNDPIAEFILPGEPEGMQTETEENLQQVLDALVRKCSEKPRLDPFGMSDSLALKLLEELSSSASIVG